MFVVQYLGGIKVSSAELERVMGLHPNVGEVAAVAVQPLVHLTLSSKLPFFRR
jgi:acyl-CoA synthetase (AMP-forming)/AMP-acid ligase II